MHKQVEKTVFSPCTVPISGGKAFIPVWVSGCWLNTVTIASLLMGGCGLRHEHVEDGCKNACVKFENPDRASDMESLIHVQAKVTSIEK